MIALIFELIALNLNDIHLLLELRLINKRISQVIKTRLLLNRELTKINETRIVKLDNKIISKITFYFDLEMDDDYENIIYDESSIQLEETNNLCKYNMKKCYSQQQDDYRSNIIDDHRFLITFKSIQEFDLFWKEFSEKSENYQHLDQEIHQRMINGIKEIIEKDEISCLEKKHYYCLDYHKLYEAQIQVHDKKLKMSKFHIIKDQNGYLMFNSLRKFVLNIYLQNLAPIFYKKQFTRFTRALSNNISEIEFSLDIKQN